MGEATIVITTPPCLYCGKEHEVEMPLLAYRSWKGGMHIQQAWPEASPAVRELLHKYA